MKNLTLEELEDEYKRLVDENPGRTKEDAFKLYHFYTHECEQFEHFFKEHPHLKILFENKFGKWEEFNSAHLEKALYGEKLFKAREDFPLPETDFLEYLNSYQSDFQEFRDQAPLGHEKTQKFLSNEIPLKTHIKQLECQCEICKKTFEKNLTNQIEQSLKHYLDQQTEALEESILSEKIFRVADNVSKLKKQLERKLSSYRFQLKRGILNRLTKEMKNYLYELIGPKSGLYHGYLERIKSFYLSILEEEDLPLDIISEDEFKRYFSQLGQGLWKQPSYLKRDFLKFVQSIITFKRKDISSTILKDYLAQFWMHAQARRKTRKIIYHMGPTNSGKTYNAIQALSQVEKGCYLAPLRLLASELFDTLNEKGVKTTLMTGEEVIEVEGATHTSSTIEMARMNEEFDCVVIDEIQMITDLQRGWAWTRALVNIDAKEVHLCGDDSVLDLVKDILSLTHDELEIKRYERKTSLEVMKNKIKLTELEPNDALIVFSRRNALKYKMDLERLGFKVSIVYGRLSPEVRREQARKFDEGETDIMVSTDAIAMGMNLPIRRIVFSTLSKFINSKEIVISESEIKQIAGRAGRFGRFDHGQVTTLKKVDEGLELVEEALSTELAQKELAMVGPDLDIFRSVNQALNDNGLKTLKFSEFLRLFNTIHFEPPFYCVDLKEMIEVAEMVEGADQDQTLSDSEIFGFACAPVHLGMSDHVEYFMSMVVKFSKGLVIQNELIDVENDDIDYLEKAIKCVELYQWLARHFQNKYFEFDQIGLNNNKSEAIEKLNDILSQKISRRCSSCGVKLADDFEYNICEGCFGEKRFRPRRYNNDSKSDSKNKNFRKKKSSQHKSSPRRKTNKAQAYKKGRS